MVRVRGPLQPGPRLPLIAAGCGCRSPRVIVNIKTQALINATAYVEETYGRDSLSELLRRCSPAVRDRYMSAISIDWQPMSELVELLEQIELKHGQGDDQISR